MLKHILYIAGIIVLLMVIAGVYTYQQQRIDDLEDEVQMLKEDLEAARSTDGTSDENESTTQGSYTSEKGVNIVVSAPNQGSTVQSPLEVTGSVPGNWSFEGSFSVKLLDASGATIAEQPATLSGDWMIEEMVPFSTILIFSTPDAETGTLILEKANPSGQPENEDSVSIPVKF